MNSEFEKELDLLLHDGLKANPLRIEYAEKVRELAVLRDRLLADGHSVEETAKILHERRRTIGHVYKEAASRPIRDLNDRLTVDGFKEWYEKRQEYSILILIYHSA